MFIYLFVFLISIFATWCAEKTKNKITFVLWSAVAVLLPAVLAGVRDSGVGYDMLVYGNRNFEIMMEHANDSFFSFFDKILKGYFGNEWVHSLWIYLSVKFLGDINWYYFSLNFFVCFFTYLAICMNRKKGSMPLMMFVFLFSFYNMSLNVMRQSMALALALSIYSLFEKRKWFCVFIGLVLVRYSHGSGIFFAFVLFFLFLQEKNILANKKMLLLCFAFPLSFVFLDSILRILVSYRFFPVKFQDLYLSTSQSGFMATNTLIAVAIFVLMWISLLNTPRMLRGEMQIYLNNHLMYAVFMCSMIVSLWAFRISYYFYYMDILFIPFFLRMLKKNNIKYEKIVKYGMMFLIVLNWFWSIIVNNENATYPYTSKILENLL